MRKLVYCIVGILILFPGWMGWAQDQGASPVNDNPGQGITANPEQPPPILGNCIPAGQPNAGYCNGIPEPPPLDPYEQDLLNYICSHHPDAVLEVDGKPVPVDDVPLQYVREYEKSRNPDAVFEVDGISVDELTAIRDRHADELAAIPGYAGSGIDKDGIAISVEEPHGTFPDSLEGAKIHLIPAPLIQFLGTPPPQPPQPSKK